MRFKVKQTKDAAHLDFIRSLPCISCGNDICTEATHLRSGELEYGKKPAGGQQKPSDMWTLPLCGECHRTQHTMKEEHFWRNLGVNPFVLALSLFAASGDHELAHEVISRQVKR